jgi:hypothetical protein
MLVPGIRGSIGLCLMSLLEVLARVFESGLDATLGAVYWG